jgi:hypothetical protein
MSIKEYKLQDGGIIIASSPADFVTKLRESSKFDSDCTDSDYMINFAYRLKIQSGAIVRTDNPENFVEDLKDTGYLE